MWFEKVSFFYCWVWLNILEFLSSERFHQLLVGWHFDFVLDPTRTEYCDASTAGRRRRRPLSPLHLSIQKLELAWSERAGVSGIGACSLSVDHGSDIILFSLSLRLLGDSDTSETASANQVVSILFTKLRNLCNYPCESGSGDAPWTVRVDRPGNLSASIGQAIMQYCTNKFFVLPTLPVLHFITKYCTTFCTTIYSKKVAQSFCSYIMTYCTTLHKVLHSIIAAFIAQSIVLYCTKYCSILHNVLFIILHNCIVYRCVL